MRRLKPKKKKKWGWIIGGSLLAILLGSIGYIGFIASKIQTVEIATSDKALGITAPVKEVIVKKPTITEKVEVEKERTDIINIALFGVDRRNSKERGRSDSMMIATLDFKNDKIKLTSLMRDVYTPVEGHGNTKLNHAYAYGGAELAIKTINQNFGTDIRDYVTVDFFALEKIIDAIGGVDIDVKPEEVDYINQHMQETANIQKKEMVKVESEGVQTLNGMQAVSYARIRYVGNGDFERTERQRRVLSAMLSELKTVNKATLPQLLMKVSPYIETSLEREEILLLGYDYLKEAPFTMEQQRFPLDGTWSSATINGGWYMKTNLEQMKEQISDYLYEDINPTPSNENPPNESNAKRNIKTPTGKLQALEIQ